MQSCGTDTRVLGFCRSGSGGMASRSGGLYLQAHERPTHHGSPGKGGLSKSGQGNSHLIEGSIVVTCVILLWLSSFLISE